jgi:hypothetical protein
MTSPEHNDEFQRPPHRRTPPPRRRRRPTTSGLLMTFAGCMLLADVVAWLVVPSISGGTLSTPAILAVGLALAGACLRSRTHHDDEPDDHQT